MKLLENVTVIVVGGGGRLGGAFCNAIAASGGCAIVADRDLDRACQIADDIVRARGRAGAGAVDIGSPDSVDALIANTHAEHGPIHAVINCAYPRNANYGRAFEEVTYQDFGENLSTHVGGIFLVSQKMAAYFEKQGIAGNILNIASIYGVMAPRFDIYDNTPMTMPVEYAAIKSAVIHLTKYTAKYLFNRNIRCNVISPGGILDGQPEAFLAGYRKYCANTGMLAKDDISGTVIFLLSSLSSHITGQNIVVDDGFSL